MKDEPAFPVIDKDKVWDLGLTKREYFAAMAMQGFISERKNLVAMDKEIQDKNPDLKLHEGAAIAAVQYADALIKELEK